jgi:D-glycerate 3-kinase
VRLARLAGVEVSDRCRSCFSELDPATPVDYRELAALLACRWAADPPSRVGISGGQGAGKTTLGRLVKEACAHLGLRVCLLSLDDFYYSKGERHALAEQIHPLLGTRGVPGTHDMAWCARSLTELTGEGGGDAEVEVELQVELPVFDKGADDRSGTRRVGAPFDVVILEGWCIGARAVEDADLATPWNELEAQRDAAGVWRRAVNEALRESYEPVWNTLDELIYLRVPSLEAVRRWRFEQEADRAVDRRMDRAETLEFVQYYERITERMLADLPRTADWLIGLDEDHRVEAVTLKVC